MIIIIIIYIFLTLEIKIMKIINSILSICIAFLFSTSLTLADADLENKLKDMQ